MWLDDVKEVVASVPPNASWVPEWLEVTNERTSSTTRVYPECSLGSPTKENTKPIIRMLERFKPLTEKYTIEVKTGTARNAGTDAGEISKELCFDCCSCILIP
jgi:hypothetical protein